MRHATGGSPLHFFFLWNVVAKYFFGCWLNWSSSSPSCTSCVSTWVTISSTWDASTCDSDINDHKMVSMYYCVVLLLPWLLCEICVLSFSILPGSFLLPCLSPCWVQKDHHHAKRRHSGCAQLLSFCDNKYFPSSWQDEGHAFLSMEFKSFYMDHTQGAVNDAAAQVPKPDVLDDLLGVSSTSMDVDPSSVNVSQCCRLWSRWGVYSCHKQRADWNTSEHTLGPHSVLHPPYPILHRIPSTHIFFPSYPDTHTPLYIFR